MGTLQKIAMGLGIVLGLGIISKRFGAGVGLGEAGAGLSQIGLGITDVGMAPFKAVGGGLSEVATGITAFSTSLGNVGRGIGDLLASITGQPSGSYVGPGGAGSGLLPAPGNGTRTYIRPDDRRRTGQNGR